MPKYMPYHLLCNLSSNIAAFLHDQLDSDTWFFHAIDEKHFYEYLLREKCDVLLLKIEKEPAFYRGELMNRYRN